MLGAALMLAAAGGAVSPLLTGLLRYYPLHADATDVHGGQNGTIASPDFAAGPISTAMVCGTASKRVVAPPLIFSDRRTFSLSFWVRLTSNLASYAGICDQGDGGSGGPCTLSVLNTNCAAYNSPRGANGLGAGTTADSTWHHCVLVSDFVGNARRSYRDGVLVQNFTFGSVSGSADTTNNFVFGGRRDNYGAGTEYRLAEFALWDRALTAAEVTALYNGGAGKAYPFT